MGGYRICTCGESGGPLISARSAERVIGRLNELRARFKFELGSEALWNLERRAKRLKTGRAEGIFIRKLKCQKLLRVRRAHLSFSSNVPLQLKFLGPIRFKKGKGCVTVCSNVTRRFKSNECSRRRLGWLVYPVRSGPFGPLFLS